MTGLQGPVILCFYVIFTKNKLEYNFFDDVDAVCFPGGIGDSESFHSLFKENKDTIKNFVRSGRKYLGICMGAYWADKYYFDLVKDLRVSQYIKRPNSDRSARSGKGSLCVPPPAATR